MAGTGATAAGGPLEEGSSIPVWCLGCSARRTGPAGTVDRSTANCVAPPAWLQVAAQGLQREGCSEKEEAHGLNGAASEATHVISASLYCSHKPTVTQGRGQRPYFSIHTTGSGIRPGVG